MRGLNVICESTELVWSCANKALELDSLTQEQEASIIDTACYLLSRRVLKGECITKPMDAANLFRLYLGNETNEAFVVMFLTQQNTVIEVCKLFTGDLAEAAVYPRVVVQNAIRTNAKKLIFGHNHPAGSCKASAGDIAITQRLETALSYIDVEVLDHLIIGSDVYSMKAHGEIS